VAVRAVVVDVGGVLERVGPPDVLTVRWRRRLGLSRTGFQAALRRVDPDNVIETGGLTEAEFQQRYAEALGLSRAQSVEFLADMWDWYCGELDSQLTAYVASLRPRCRTAILTNSADGARREEQVRYSFDNLVDTIIYSHEVGLAKPDPRIFALTCDRLRVRPSEAAFLDDAEENIEAAREFGLQAVLHRSTPTSIASINALITA
jgi:epoxide hydrolase-like predicted phosphatase